MSAISELMTEHRRHLYEVDHVRRPPSRPTTAVRRPTPTSLPSWETPPRPP